MTPPKLIVKEFVKGRPVKKFEKGKVYVVDFLAVECAPCLKVIPHLAKLQKKYLDVVFIGIGLHDQQSPGKVKAFVEKKGKEMDYQVAVDAVPKGKDTADGAMAKSWMMAAGLIFMPAIFIVDGNGKIAWIGDPTEMDAPLEKIRSGKWDLKAAAAESAKSKDDE